MSLVTDSQTEPHNGRHKNCYTKPKTASTFIGKIGKTPTNALPPRRGSRRDAMYQIFENST